MQRAKWALPSKHSALCTLKFMGKVRELVYYCPKVTDVNKDKICLCPPPKDVLMEKLYSHLEPKLASGEYPVAQTKPIRALLKAMKKR